MTPTFAGFLRDRTRAGMASIHARRAHSAGSAATIPSRGVALTGTIWTGGAAEPSPGMIIIDGAGLVAAVHFGARPTLPHELLVLGGEQHWIGPAIIDAHVQSAMLASLRSIAAGPAPRPWPDHAIALTASTAGLGGVRELGVPLDAAQRWRTGHRRVPNSIFVASSGPILSVAGGYPLHHWPGPGYVEEINSPAHARNVVHQLATDGVDLIVVALDPGDSARPVASPEVLAAAVRAAHAAGLQIVAHAVGNDMVSRALDAGVDELVRMPTERLTPRLIDRLAAAQLPIVSTLQAFCSTGAGRRTEANATDLVAAGARIVYGTAAGLPGTIAGVDPRELDRIAAAGVGRLGALRAATEFSAAVAGMRTRTGLVRVGEPAAVVMLSSDPLAEPGAWRAPSAVYSDGRLTVMGVPDRLLTPVGRE